MELMSRLLVFVSKDVSNRFGTWDFDMDFDYNRSTKEINGQGSYDLVLDNTLSSEGRDLNLYKIASNYLNDVLCLEEV